MVRRFKTLTLKRYADGVRAGVWPAFEIRLWQRNYYEHIIRDDDDWARIEEYIRNNPLAWAADEEHPGATRERTPGAVR
jgi:REP element-mobilizing transposase RayT